MRYDLEMEARREADRTGARWWQNATNEDATVAGGRPQVAGERPAPLARPLPPCPGWDDATPEPSL